MIPGRPIQSVQSPYKHFFSDSFRIFFENFYFRKSFSQFFFSKKKFGKNSEEMFVRTLCGLYWSARYHAVASKFLSKKTSLAYMKAAVKRFPTKPMNL